MAVNYRVHERAVQAYIVPGGEVNDLLWDICRSTRDIAKVKVPKRTSRLMRSIRANRPKPTGLLRAAGYVGANAKNALWVHDGTPPILASGKGYLTVPRMNQGGPVNASGSTLRKSWIAAGGYKSGDSKPYFTTKGVRGQNANPYLADALGVALAKEARLTYTRF